MIGKRTEYDAAVGEVLNVTACSFRTRLLATADEMPVKVARHIDAKMDAFLKSDQFFSHLLALFELGEEM